MGINERNADLFVLVAAVGAVYVGSGLLMLPSICE